MRKLAIIFLLLSLSILFVEPLNAQQTRPRQVGQQSVPPAPDARPEPTPPQTGNSAPEEVDEDEVIRVNTTLVTIPVNVTDRNGHYVGNLRQQDFRIYEDGVEQEIAYF